MPSKGLLSNLARATGTFPYPKNPVKTINLLKDELKIAVMEADIDSDVDTRTIAKLTGVDAIQLHTGGMCHLDAGMTKQGIDSFNDHYDLIILDPPAFTKSKNAFKSFLAPCSANSPNS